MHENQYIAITPAFQLLLALLLTRPLLLRMSPFLSKLPALAW
jgi:hypothetical protein